MSQFPPPLNVPALATALADQVAVVTDGTTTSGTGVSGSPIVASAASALYFSVKSYGAVGNAAAAWQISTAYLVGQQVLGSGANVYQCTTAGTSGSAGPGPAGTGSGIADGTCVWQYLRTATDDTAAIRAAATAAAAANGGKVYFPNAFYLISENGTSFRCLDMLTNVSWLGQSREGAVLVLSGIRASDSTATRASVRPFSTAGAGIQDFSISDLTIDGNRYNQTVADSNHRDNIFLFNATRVTVERCELRNATGSGIVVFGLGGGDVHVDRCYMHDNQWMGISWGDAGNTYRTRVTHCYFTRNVNGLHIEISQPNGEIVFDHCWMDGNGGLAMEIGGSAAPNQTSNVWVRNCTIMGGLIIVNAAQIVVDGNYIFCNDSSANNTVPVQVNGDTQDVYIAHNTITLGAGATAAAAVYITGNTTSTTSLDNVVCHDNTIYVQTTTQPGVRVQPTGTARVQGNKIIAFGYVAWQANTQYAPAIHTSGSTRVSNGGNVYQCIPGTSAGSGGPTGTGSGIVDNTVIWNYVGAGSNQPQWLANTQYLPGNQVRNNGNIYICIAGTSGNTGPSGTGSAIVDGTVVWQYMGAVSTTQYGVDINMSLARNGDQVVVRGNYIADFNTGVVTRAAASTIKINYCDISDNTFEAVTPGVMTNGIQWEVDTRASINAARCIGNKVIGNAITLIGTYPHADLLIGGNDGGISIWSCASAPTGAANPGSLAMSRSGGAGVTFYVKETGTGTSGWAAALTQTQGSYAIVGQAPSQVAMASGRYYALPNFGSLSTNNNFGVGTLRALPFWVPNNITIAAIGAEVTAGGDSTSVLRLGIYADDGTGRPGARILDAGTVLANSGGAGVPGVQMITGLSTALTPGVYWAVAVLQGTVTTQPTFRTIDARGIMPNLDLGTTTPGAAAVVSGFNMNSVTGGLPSPFTVNSLSSVTPRIIIQVQ